MLQLALSLLFLLPAARATDEPTGPQDGVFLIRNVAVWEPGAEPVPGRSLLLRNGLIEAVGGSELPAPPEARILDAPAGWTVYPGLIHAAYKDGISELEQSPYPDEATDPKTNSIPEMEFGPRKDLRGWLLVADRLAWEPGKHEKWRGAGFTSVYIVPQEGLVRGSAAWVSLNDRPLGQALLDRQGLLTLSLAAKRGGYPRTAMAALATLRQVFLDAERMNRIQRTGTQRHHADPDLYALRTRTGEPLLFAARSAREIENVLDLVDEFAPGRKVVILGGRDADKLAPRLKTAGAAVLFELELEDPPKSDEDLKIAPADERPWWQEAARLRESRRAEHARQVSRFQRLRASGVPCALVPGGQPKDLTADLEQLAEGGLGADEILTALSADLGGILGLQGVGRIDSGAPADFFISRGSWNPADPDLAWVFADGRGYEMPAKKKKKAKAERGEKTGDEDDPADVFDGEWVFQIEAPGETIELHVILDTAAGTAVIFRGDEPQERSQARAVEFGDFTFSFQFEPPDAGFSITLKAEVFGEDAEGVLLLPEGMGEMEIEGSRVEKPGSAGHRSGSGLASGRQDPHEEVQDPHAEPAAEPGAAEEAGEEDEEDSLAVPKGHPEPPVETRADRLPALQLAGEVLITGATLYPMTGEDPFVGDLLIADGKIAGIGPEIRTLRAVPTIDAAGWHLMPAIIDAHSHLALDAVNEGSLAITAECRIGDMIRPESVAIYRAAAGGTAVVQSLHGSANPVGGQAEVWELDVSRATIAELVLPGAPQGIKFALGENVKQSNWGSSGDRFPISRPGVEAVYRRAFTRAREYAEERRLAAAGRNPNFRRDVRLEVLAGVLANKIHVQCHSYRADEILMFLRICKEFGIQRPTFQHVLEGYKVAPEMAAAGAMGSTFSDWWAYKIEAYDAIPWNPALMHRAGVVASINSDSNEMIRRLNTEAGKSLLYGGLSYDESMALCTLNPARQLRIDDRLGTLEVGKDGSVSVFDGPPLSTHSRCMLTLARGRVLFEWPAGQDAAWDGYAGSVAAYASAHREPAEPEAPRARAAADWDRWTRAGKGRSYFIRNATIHPVSAAPFAGGLLVENGRIEWIGVLWDGPLPADCVDVDASGLNLYPGFINCGDRIGLFEIGSVRGTIDHAETGSMQPDLSMATAIHGESAHFRVHRMTGITTALVHGSRGRITGQAALIHLDGEVTPDFVVVPDLALHLRFPQVSAPKPGKAPEDPEGIEQLDKWFDDALDYGERLDRCREAGSSLPERDLKLEALLPYARGEKPLLLEAGRWLTLVRAWAWVRARGLDAVYLAGRDAWKAAGILGIDQSRVITGPVHTLPAAEHDPFDSPYRNPAMLSAAGCAVGLRTADPEVTRNLPFQAATGAAHGWGREAALRALTLGAAEVLGVDDMAGSIEVGKVADFFLCTGDPLDFQSEVVRMWIGGREVELSSKQTGLRDRYLERIQRLSPSTR